MARLFRETIGSHGATVAIEERASGRVRLRCWDAATAKHVYVPLSLEVRDPSGKLDIVKIQTARNAALTLVAAREMGLPAAIPEQVPASPVPTTRRPSPSSRDPFLTTQSHYDSITLENLFQDYLSIPNGRYVISGLAQSEAESKAIDIVKSLGPNTLVRDLKSDDYCQLWRSLATRYAGGETREIQVGRKRSDSCSGIAKRAVRTIRWGGPRHAEQTVLLLFDALRFGGERGKVECVPALPWRWSQRFRKDWEDITGEKPNEPKEEEGPRYTLQELRKIFKVLAQADPRLYLAIELAFEARLGQVLRARRGDLDLTALPYGKLTITGRATKAGTEILLTKDQRLLVDRMMRVNYLQPLEAALGDGRISDYALFPGGKIGYGFDPLRANAPLTASGLRSMFLRLEHAAGVAHAEGRGWYGFRRSGSDMAEDLAANDPLVAASLSSVSGNGVTGPNDPALNSITGHADTRSRRRYQKKHAPRVLKQAQIIRDGVRRQLRDEDGEDPNRTDLVQE